ncbi:hypothetical protein ACFPIH_23865 [Streptomyces vulcanius]|uniref:MarR family transcriptional regulator n=1 Tax=Streptomyces vulcanius TaxID=1441876 RepID=A0ABV9ASU2_9ACTN
MRSVEVARLERDEVGAGGGHDDAPSLLARGAFVTRQSMNVLAARLTPRGRRSLEKATVAVRSVEVRMLAGMTGTEQSAAFRILPSMIHSLRDDNDGA